MKLKHVGLIVSDLKLSADFYEGVLGLKRDQRPDLGFDGIFYSLGDGQQIHLMCINNPCDNHARPKHGGRDWHVALGVDDLSLIQARLELAGVDFTMSKSGRKALFCRDPDGNAIELMEDV